MTAVADQIQDTTERLQQIWEPLTIGGTRVRNRIMMTAQSVLFGKDNILGDRHIEYYRERAKGGVGLFICEQQGAHKYSKGSFYEGCSAWEPRAIPQYAKLADAVHEHGGRQFVQLFGTGVHDKGTTIFDEWHPLWGVSKVASVVHHEVPMVMEVHHIAEMVEAFGKSGLNAKVAGVDGVEIHAAHSYLNGQFMSRAYNKRDDQYGGSVENRCRFAIECAQAIRSACGPDFTIGIRLTYDEFVPGGITADESDEIVDILVRTGLFDFFNISAGGYHTLFRAVPPTGTPKGEFLPFGKRAKDIVGDRAKVFVVGRITDLSIAERAVREGCADMVAMTRAMMADPYHVRKTLEGRAQDIVYCVGANECINRAFLQRPATCVVNPAVGREAYWRKDNLHAVTAAEAQKIVVVGGGPAGMHAAELLGQRGHKVVLMEKSDRLGGHLNNLIALPRWKEWGVAIDNLQRGMAAGQVDVRLNACATHDALQNEKPNVVIVATGSQWDKDGLTPYRPDRDRMPGADQGHVFDLGTALAKSAPDPLSLGKKVVIIEETGGYPQLGLAERLASAGVDVTLITPRDTAGADLIGRGEMFIMLPRLMELGVPIHTQALVDRVDGKSVIWQSIWGGPVHQIHDVDAVVLAILRSPNDALYHEIKGAFPRVERIGDCVAPRAIVQVMYEAEELGRAI
jgi:2,4-dienoyl-CoA reductase-like NADH-dependent reductase (Old Yellow Enzyme family)/thioredoxin reductase